MRIAIVTPWFPTRVNPVSGSFVLKDATAFQRAGLDILVLHLVPPHEDDGVRQTYVEGIRTIRIPMSTKNPVDMMRARTALTPYLEGADIVHTQALSAIEPFVFKRPKQPWVHTEHWSAITTPSTLSEREQKLLPYLLKMSALPDVTVSVCQFLADAIRPARSKRIEIIPCQVPSPTRLMPRRPDPKDLRLICTGALIERKDPIIAVKTLKVLQDRGHAVSLTWLGEGPLRESAQQLVKELGVNATFPGTKSPAEVRVALGEADIFFGPTRADNFFVAAAESIVNGRPLVVGANGGQGEYIDPRVGATVPVQDPVAYADAIEDVHRRTQNLSAQEIAATVGDRFEPHTIARQYQQLYQELAGR
ncbi:glycosyltransferase family 4 protein [Gleimia hominis]|uniref:Glycosyltransferase family 4 protein n=1 Tax=Gleimia hominis TaxID=595468 RepID=A0ABU3ID95_9ACTO|nr:glycosyltransferase family 4 protein [Gleimia hominis]MDT3767210.1 glycosyltransferase family 4 protein [Gleimia hominis]